MPILPLVLLALLAGGPAAAQSAAAGRRRKVRAVYCNPSTGAYPGDWDRSARLLARNGFNMVLANVLWGGVADYASDVLPRSAAFEQYGDQVQQCCAAAKKYGIEFHVWRIAL